MKVMVTGAFRAESIAGLAQPGEAAAAHKEIGSSTARLNLLSRGEEIFIAISKESKRGVKQKPECKKDSIKL